MSELHIGRIETDPATEKVRKRVFAILYIGLAFVPFIVYSAFFTQKTEIVYVGQACEEQLKAEKEKVDTMLKFQRSIYQ